jgi:hypothetical protein
MHMLGLLPSGFQSSPFSRVQVASVVQYPTSVIDWTRQMVCAHGWSAHGMPPVPRNWHATGAGSMLGSQVVPPVAMTPPVAAPPGAVAPPVVTTPPVAEPPVALPPVATAPPVAMLPPVVTTPPVARVPPVVCVSAPPLETVVPELGLEPPLSGASKLTEESEQPSRRPANTTTRRIQRDYHHRSQIQ